MVVSLLLLLLTFGAGFCVMGSCSVVWFIVSFLDLQLSG